MHAVSWHPHVDSVYLHRTLRTCFLQITLRTVHCKIIYVLGKIMQGLKNEFRKSNSNKHIFLTAECFSSAVIVRFSQYIAGFSLALKQVLLLAKTSVCLFS